MATWDIRCISVKAVLLLLLLLLWLQPHSPVRSRHRIGRELNLTKDLVTVIRGWNDRKRGMEAEAMCKV